MVSRCGLLLSALVLYGLSGRCQSADLKDAPITPGAIVLRNGNGMEAHILPTGACVQRLLVPDKDGVLADVMLGFDDAEPYRNGTSPSGCIVGRVGNRISGAQFTLDGVTYKLEANAGKKDTIHGGGIGYQRLEWEEEGTCRTGNHSWVSLSHFSPAGEQGFPGNLSVHVVYTLTENNEVVLDIHATTDQATPVNVMSHPYFNLAGHASGDILAHELTVNGGYYTVNGDGNIPTGEIAPVEGTPLDFLTPHPLGERMADPALIASGGYSYNAVLFDLGPDSKDVLKGFKAADPAQLAATLYDPVSGRGLDILTTAPSLVVYTGNAFKGTMAGKCGFLYQKYAAIALEAVMFPDAINQPNFPSPVVRPGQEYHNQAVWRFFNGRTAAGQAGDTAQPKTCLAAGCKQNPPTSTSNGVAFFVNTKGQCKPCASHCAYCTNIAGACQQCNSGYRIEFKADGRPYCLPTPACSAGKAGCSKCKGKRCIRCKPAKYANSNGQCKPCGKGCALCKNTTGVCVKCQKGLTATDAGRCAGKPQ